MLRGLVVIVDVLRVIYGRVLTPDSFPSPEGLMGYKFFLRPANSCFLIDLFDLHSLLRACHIHSSLTDLLFILFFDCVAHFCFYARVSYQAGPLINTDTYFSLSHHYLTYNMLNPTLFVLLASAGLIEGRSVLDTGHMERHMQTRHTHGLMEGRSVQEPSRRIHAFLHKRQNNNDASGTTLLANTIQTGSFSDGSINGAQKPGQSASKTSKNNFINLCAGKTLTNGLQVVAGSCNGIRKSQHFPSTSHVDFTNIV